MKILYKIAASLRSKRQYKLAQQVIDLLQRKKQKDQTKQHNDQVLQDVRKEDVFQDILTQHQQNKRNFEMAGTDIAVPSDSPEERRFEVTVSYPNFDEQGAPYFDDTSVRETLSMTQDELDNHKWQEQQGYMKIHSVQADIPRSRD